MARSIDKDVEKAASKVAGKPLHVAKTKNLGTKGADYHFKEGGLLKVRPKLDGAVIAKLQGQPESSSRFVGVGTSDVTALASLKPEKGSKTAPIKPVAKPVAKPGPASADINGLTLINDVKVDETAWKLYAGAAKDAVDLLKRRGFGFMLKNVRMYLRQATKPGVLGNYDMRKAVVEIFVNNLGASGKQISIMTTMVHELGHHYYYREIPRSMRKKYEWYFGLAKKPTEKGEPSGDFPSNYARTARYEDFAEIFAAFVGKGHQLSKRYNLGRDAMDRFRNFLATDKRIDLREDRELWEERPMRSGSIAVSARSADCKNPTPCGDRMRSSFRPKSPTDNERATADRMATLSHSLKSALLCRDAADITKYVKALGQALAGIKKAVSSSAAKKAFDDESYIKCPATESTDFPSKYASPVATSSRTGIGTAPVVDGRTEIEMNDLKRRRLKSIKQA